MSRFVIIAHGPVSGTVHIHGEYLEAYDPEAHHGRGDATFTNDVKLAKKFASEEEAVAFATQRPTKMPTRYDGRPNRPLCAFNLEFVDIDDKEARSLLQGMKRRA